MLEDSESFFIDDQGGSGDAILFVHGLGGTSNTFTPQAQVLKHDHHVVAYDLAGSGRSALPAKSTSAKLTIDRHVDDLARLASQLNAERFYLVGHSMGTIICQHFAARFPERIAGFALFGAFPEPPPAAREALRARAESARKDGMRPIADTIVANGIAAEVRRHQPAAMAFVRESIMTQSREGYAANCEALAAVKAADLSQVRCPVLLITGDADKTAPPDVARAMASSLNDAEVNVVPACGHWPTIERANHSNYSLARFFATLRQRSRA